MRESSVYQVILEEGREEGRIQGREEGRIQGEQEGQLKIARALLLSLATERLGQLPADATAAIASISDLNRLVRMTLHAPKATSWDDLLHTP
jgi:predicted transposase YdaD